MCVWLADVDVFASYDLKLSCGHQKYMNHKLCPVDTDEYNKATAFDMAIV